jgi:hypothetical protein
VALYICEHLLGPELATGGANDFDCVFARNCKVVVSSRVEYRIQLSPVAFERGKSAQVECYDRQQYEDAM